MIAPMENHLECDVYDLDLTTVKGNTELRKVLIDKSSKSIIVIEDTDSSCKELKFTMTECGPVRVRVFIELLLPSKLGGLLRWSSVQILPNTDTVRAKVIVTSELSLFRKFEKITALDVGRGITTGGNPEGCQGQKIT